MKDYIKDFILKNVPGAVLTGDGDTIEAVVEEKEENTEEE